MRFGIIGAGNIANKFCDAAKLVQGAEVTAVSSKSMERAQAFAEKNGIPQAFDSYEEMKKQMNDEVMEKDTKLQLELQ